MPTAAWEAAIAKDLKGADYEKKLVWRTEEGLAIRPYYRKEALAGLEGQLRTAPDHYPFVRGTGRSWEIAQDAKPGPKAIRADLLHEAGAHAIQELGYGIAAGVERLAELTATLPVETVRRQIEFVFAVGPSLFHRDRQTACRAHPVGAGGDGLRPGRRRRLPHAPARAHAASATRAPTTATPTCCASPPKRSAAAVGGCDQLTVAALRLRSAPGAERPADPQGRIAPGRGGRSRRRLLLHRSADRFAGAAKPGSCCNRWKPKAATPRRWLPGSIEKALAETRAAREKAYSARRRALVGVNNYPNVAEKTPEAAIPAAETGDSALPRGAHRRAVREDPPAHHRARASRRAISRRCCCSNAATSR